MFCRKCYANLDQATDFRWRRCRRQFNPASPKTYLRRPLPSRRKIIVHTILNLILTSIVSVVIAALLAAAQIKYIHSGHSDLSTSGLASARCDAWNLSLPCGPGLHRVDHHLLPWKVDTETAALGRMVRA